MNWIHPILQCATVILAAYVLRLGWDRFAAVSLGRKGRFQWKRHVTLGKAAIFMWIYGMLVGAAASWDDWRRFGVTGSHFYDGLAIVLLVLFGYASGWYMDTNKKKRATLPLLHGAANALALLLSLYSLISGIRLLLKYFL